MSICVCKVKGQIHAHLLAITEDSTDKDGINMKFHKHKDDDEKKARLLSEWASKTFGMTAKHPGVNKDVSRNDELNEKARQY